MFYTALASAAFVVSIAALAIALLARSYSRDCYLYVRKVAESEPQFTEMAALGAELTAQKDALAQISKGLRTIRNRMNVRETNAKRKVANDSQETDDEAWIRTTNARLQAGGRSAFELETGE
ncbi:MAG: hypothetical protein GY949_18255 [Gammaproteobacteria bacterium]|nr:hypothetical protein [Gammaproteobacteria bacterium]